MEMRRGIGFCLALVTLLFMVPSAPYCAKSPKPSEEQIHALLQAIKGGNITLTKDLLQRRPILVNTPNQHGITPLMVAIFDKQEDIVKLLVSKGANVNAEDGVLSSAAYTGHVGIVEYLISQGGDVNGRNYWGGTPLFGAAEGGRLKAAQILIAHGANVKARNEDGNTVLLTAVSDRQADIARFFIEKGVDVNQANNDGIVPLHRAANAYTARLLISKGAKVNAADPNGLTPLHMAAFYGRLSVTRVLIEKGANLTAKTTGTVYLLPEKATADVILPPGLTPREFAEKAGQTEVANLLAKAEAGLN